MLKDELTESLVLTNAAPKDWREAATMAGNLLLKEGKIKKPYIKSMIHTVENYGPYMILLPKVCLFHGEPGDNVLSPGISLCVFQNEICFTDFANQPIRCCFGFGAVDKDSHMSLLMELSQLLQDEQLIELITNNGSKEKILKIIAKY